jgi:hypothetical protein
MKAIAAGSLVRRAGLFLVLATCATRAEAQDCQALMQQLLSGGSDVQWAMRAQEELNRNCRGQTVQPPQNQQPTYIAPTYNPQQNAAPTQNSLPNAMLQELAKLGELTKPPQQMLPKDIPLSSGTVKMETVAAPPPAAPTDYADPFAQSTPAPGSAPMTQSPSGPVKSYGSIWDPNQITGLSPPAAPSVTPQQPSPKPGPCGLYGELCNAPFTGFDRPAVVTPLPQSR